MPAGASAKGKTSFSQQPANRIKVLGGIGTALENSFLLDYYETDGRGWGSPFLLVPEATNMYTATLQLLSEAKQEDFFLSDV